MRFDRRSSVAGIALIGVALVLVVDPLGVRATFEEWYGVTDPASGSTSAVAAAVAERAQWVDALHDALAADPTLSIALLATGIGIGLIAGSALAYRHQRRRLRRGERDG